MAKCKRSSLIASLPVHVRLANESDLPRLEWCGQYRHYRRLFKTTYLDQQAGRRIMLLADCQSNPIGQVFIQLASDNTKVVDGKTRAYFYAVRVMPAFRAKGIGTMLLTEAETTIANRGYTLATLAVSKSNLRAQRLYQRLGYLFAGEDDGVWRYRDHIGIIRHIHDPCWILEKAIKLL